MFYGETKYCDGSPEPPIRKLAKVNGERRKRDFFKGRMNLKTGREDSSALKNKNFSPSAPNRVGSRINIRAVSMISSTIGPSSVTSLHSHTAVSQTEILHVTVCCLLLLLPFRKRPRHRLTFWVWEKERKISPCCCEGHIVQQRRGAQSISLLLLLLPFS